MPDDLEQRAAAFLAPLLALPDDQWTEISNNAKDLYETWLRGTQYSISTNLLKHIVTCIEGIV